MEVNMLGLVNNRVKVVSPTTAMATNITKLFSLYHSLYVDKLEVLYIFTPKVIQYIGSRRLFHH